MITSTQATFDIRNFTDRLTPASKNNRYICPVCGGNNLTINPKDGKYKCWNECECRDIREAVAPWDEVKGSSSHDNQQNQANTAIPTLWVDDVLKARHLYDLFHVMQYSPGETLKIEPGSDHYILHTSLTPEALTKTIAWSILASGASCRVHGINNTLENLVGDKSAARELTIQIFQFSRPYEEWATWNDETKLTLKQAAEIARVAIALLPEPQKSIELGTLRERCNQIFLNHGISTLAAPSYSKSDLTCTNTTMIGLYGFQATGNILPGRGE